MTTISTQCCIVGGGPAGIMLGYLLARAGVDIVVLEKWPDFNRDFRGDTIHPSTMDILFELGLLDAFLKLPYNKITELVAKIADQNIVIADFSLLNVRCPFVAFIPQWDFLNFIAEQAKQYSTFHLHMETEAVGLIEENGHIVGVKAKNGDKQLSIRSDLVIGADGRHSIVREKSGLMVESLGAPMDVLWFHLPRNESDPDQIFGKIDLGRMMVMIDRKKYWQCGFLIRKGEIEKIRSEGLDAFRDGIGKLVPFMRDRVSSIQSWDDVKLLTVVVDRLQQWYKPGLLCIGDSAHAMSPIGGVGINLAIQDAVAAANRLAPAFLNHTRSEKDLADIQKRREWPTKFIQSMQVFIQSRVIDQVLGGAIHPKVPLPLKFLQRLPIFRRLTAYLIGVGIRPEKPESRFLL